MRTKIGCIAALISATAVAEAKPVVAVAKAGGGQPALAVGFDAEGALRAKVCPGASCDVAGGKDLELPLPAKDLRAKARLTVVPIGQGRRAVVVTIPDPARERAWEAVVAAQPGANEPRIVFRGWTGNAEGEYGLRHGGMVMISEPRRDGTRSIVIGEQREDLSLCGRPAVLAPKLLWPADLSLKPAKVQRLTPSERAGATELTAKRAEPIGEEKRYPLLRAVGATSAVGEPRALTDGDPETTWSENRGGSGKGEFVLMQTPPALPITAFELVVRPPKAAVPQAVAPKELWLATTDRILHVTLPENAWEHPGARYVVTLDRPVQSDCVALVTETAWGGDAKSRVTLAELSARTELDASTLDGLVGALAGGGKRAEAAAAALSALGDEAFAAVARAWDKLDEGGRRVALDVMDHAPCEIRSPLYVRALLSPYPAHRLHARDRLRTCGEPAALAIEAALAKAKRRAHPLLVNELALVAPGRAVRAAVPLLPKADRRGRQLLRVAIGRASRHPDATSAVRELLRADLPEVARIDLLRSLGDRIGSFQPEAGRVLATLTAGKPSFRTRYLLLEPAAELSRVDPTAKAFVARSLVSDASHHVRVRAAEVIPAPQPFQSELTRAIDDPEVRVREAALDAVARRYGSFAAKPAARRLTEDRWPLVRVAAAKAIAEMGRGDELDAALAGALEDSSHHVRAQVVVALGERGARKYAPALRERLADDEERAEVRGSAALALGLLCDTASVDELTEHAQKLSDPLASPERRAIGTVSLGALSRIRPPDLRERLAPLMGKDASPLARRAAEAALRSRSGACRR